MPQTRDADPYSDAGHLKHSNLIPALLAIAAGAVASYAYLSRRGTDPYSFKDRVVLITGGARGLGFAMAREFAARGARLVLVSRTAAELARAEAWLRQAGADVTVRQADVRSRAEVDALVRDVERAVGPIDVLVNNAGIIQIAPFEHTPDEDFEDSLQTHFWGPLHLIRACLPSMKDRRGSRIINISSIGGRLAVPHLLSYSVGKFALVALSEGLSAELAKDGIVVTTVTPGIMRTGSHRNVTVRGRQEAEASWFALGSATPLTSMSASRAAAQIVDASEDARTRVSPGWQSEAAQRVNILAPEITTALAGFAARWLPSPGGPEPDRAMLSRDLDLSWVAPLLPTHAAVEFNQPIGRGESAAG